MENNGEDRTPSLADERRDLTRSRIRQAAMEVVAEKGFDATVEEISQRSGVSVRTVFRHYGTQDRLIADAVADMCEAVGLFRRWEVPYDEIEHLPGGPHELDGWMEELTLRFHTQAVSIFGVAFWDIHTPRAHASPVLSEVNARRHMGRVNGIRQLVRFIWRTAGGIGEPPEALTMAFALNLSAFTTHALMIDFD